MVELERDQWIIRKKVAYWWSLYIGVHHLSESLVCPATITPYYLHEHLPAEKVPTNQFRGQTPLLMQIRRLQTSLYIDPLHI